MSKIGEEIKNEEDLIKENFDDGLTDKKLYMILLVMVAAFSILIGILTTFGIGLVSIIILELSITVDYLISTYKAKK
jgi:hypothetical protein